MDVDGLPDDAPDPAAHHEGTALRMQRIGGLARTVVSQRPAETPGKFLQRPADETIIIRMAASEPQRGVLNVSKVDEPLDAEVIPRRVI
jgi:hypothetical protein